LDLCDEYKIEPFPDYRQQWELLEKGASASAVRTDPAIPLRRRIAELEAKLTYRNEVIAALLDEQIEATIGRGMPDRELGGARGLGRRGRACAILERMG
jgi:hypothetical protein